MNTEVDLQQRVTFTGENVPAHYEEGLDTRLAGRGNDLPINGHIQLHQGEGHTLRTLGAQRDLPLGILECEALGN